MSVVENFAAISTYTPIHNKLAEQNHLSFWTLSREPWDSVRQAKSVGLYWRTELLMKLPVVSFTDHWHITVIRTENCYIFRATKRCGNDSLFLSVRMWKTATERTRHACIVIALCVLDIRSVADVSPNLCNYYSTPLAL
jgi:hypothetical protein